MSEEQAPGVIYMKEDEIPKTLAEALQWFDEHLTEEVKTTIRNTALADTGHYYDLGHRGLRNAWNLWGTQKKDKSLYNYFCGLGVPHGLEGPCAPGDDIGGIISTAYWHHLHELPYDLEADVKWYQDYWAKTGGR